MAKKRKGKNPEKTGKKKTTIVFWIAGAIAVTAVALFATGTIPFGSGSEAKKGKSFQLTERETRPVLDPFQFSGQTRRAYAAAKKYPEILNEVFCYCYCDASPFYHKTLLSCFTDKHGAG